MFEHTPGQAIRDAFCLSSGVYFLSHSVGRPLRSAQGALQEAFLEPWQGDGDSFPEVWDCWLRVLDDFRAALALLFNSAPEGFCPQVNLSSAVSKIVMSLDVLRRPGAVVLMSEIDFPSMGFALRQALPESCELRFIPETENIADPQVWENALTSDVCLAFVSRAYSNTGQLAPWADLFSVARDRGILTVLDVAQSAGVIPLDLRSLAPTFLVGSSVKWLCGGPGAGFLWVNPGQIEHCHPRDVGWFSHQTPFEMDIHHFEYHPDALRFLGGTPSIAPFAIAGPSIRYFAELGSQTVYQYNQKCIDQILSVVGESVVSPLDPKLRSGTCVLHFGPKQEKAIQLLRRKNIASDVRKAGIRISPHVYNHPQDLDFLLQTFKTILA